MNKEQETFTMLFSDNLKEELKNLTNNGQLILTLLIKTQWGGYDVVDATYNVFSDTIHLEQFSCHYELEDVYSYAVISVRN